MMYLDVQETSMFIQSFNATSLADDFDDNL